MKKEACGVFGVISKNEDLTSSIIYNGLMALQHRGQESCGISLLNEFDIKLKKFMGLVSNSIPSELLKKLKGRIGIGHVRYSTVGGSRIRDAQPFLIDYPKRGIVLAHNGNLVNYMDLRKELSENGRHLSSTCDAEIILNVLAEELIKGNDIENAVLALMQRVEGSYSTVAFTGKGQFIAFRDPNSFRPFCYGKSKDKLIFASESVALQANDVKLKSDVRGGELIISDESGKIERKRLLPCKRKHCMFEYVYFSRPDSVIEGRSVYDVRVKLGENLAKTYSTDGADVIVPVPDTSRPAAEGIARVTGLPVAEGLIKNRYVWRTFIMPTQTMRDNAINVKLNPVKSVLKDKHVILVDDSIVRGTTSKRIVKLVKKAGAKKVDLWVTCPPIISPCFYGIDIATHGELIAANNTIEEIRKIIGADRLCYQTIEGLVDAIGIKRSDLCLACLTGEYPTPLAQSIADKMKNQTSLKRIRYWEKEME